MRIPILLAVILSLSPYVFAQTVEINRQNRTIEVVVTERVQVDADVAKVTLGCVTYGQTHDQAYQANLEISDKVLKALAAAGVPKTEIETGSIELTEASAEDLADKPDRKARQFKAHQSWRVRTVVGDAQKVIDVAVQAGANGIEEVNWDIADSEALEAKARVAAMEKARRTAAEIATSGGGNLGELIYASNVLNGILGLLAPRTIQTTTASLGSSRGSPTPKFFLQLFPEKIERQATVRAVFAFQ